MDKIGKIKSKLEAARNVKIDLEWKLKHGEELKMLATNKQFQDYYKNMGGGRSCFILGNGPSLKKQDLSLLSNQFVFTVNQMARVKDFSKIKTNVHIWSDMNYFNEELSGSTDLLEVMRGVKTSDNSPICFFPIDARDFIQKHYLQQDLHCYYFRQYRVLHEGFDGPFDLTKTVPSASTVVIVAITIALYMGFNQIYLLGCDCTSAAAYINSYEKKEMSEYAFTIPIQQSLEIAKTTFYKYSSEYKFAQFYDILKEYRIIGEYCKRHGIELVNCTAGGILDCLPRQKYENVIARRISG